MSERVESKPAPKPPPPMFRPPPVKPSMAPPPPPPPPRPVRRSSEIDVTKYIIIATPLIVLAIVLSITYSMLAQAPSTVFLSYTFQGAVMCILSIVLLIVLFVQYKIIRALEYTSREKGMERPPIPPTSTPPPPPKPLIAPPPPPPRPKPIMAPTPKTEEKKPEEKSTQK